MNEHQMHQQHGTSHSKKEYFKFFVVIVGIILGAIVYNFTFGFSTMGFLDSFMGVFFLVFAGFKMWGYKEFIAGFPSYDVIAKRFVAYAYLYPFIQLLFAFGYLFVGGSRMLDVAVVVISLVSGYGVLRALRSKAQFHCVCLGSVIKLPLSTISFVEDFGMAIMALIMFVLR